MGDAIGFRQQLSTTSFEAFELEITVNIPVHTWTENSSFMRNLTSWSVPFWLVHLTATNAVYCCLVAGQIIEDVVTCFFGTQCRTVWYAGQWYYNVNCYIWESKKGTGFLLLYQMQHCNNPSTKGRCTDFILSATWQPMPALGGVC